MILPKTEVILKITREVFNLFKIAEDFQTENELDHGIVTTRLIVNDKIFTECGRINPNEREGAEIHRLVKRNLYQIFLREFNKAPAPYGILHGVRPIKIIHRWIRAGFGVNGSNLNRQEIEKRIIDDYLVSKEKAKLLTDIAVRQIPILNTSDIKTISIYVGIPFCVTRCLYCSFPSNVLPNESKIAEFMSVLEKDITAAKSDCLEHGFKVQTIYIGGGTPTALPNIYFEQMLQMVYSAFYDKSVAEFTVECGRPDTITPEKIAAMVNFKVTRVSVNPQSMQQKTLDRIGRRHTPEDIVNSFNALRHHGAFKINMDLILGLPGENINDVGDSVEKVIALNPDDITLHALAIKRGSRLQMNLDDNINSLDDFNLPSDEQVRAMSALANNLILQNGYEPYYLYRQGYMSGQIENIGYSRGGSIGIYNVQIMDEQQTILGIGGAATTKVVDFKNNRLKSTFHPKDLITYLRDIDYYINKRTALLQEIYNRPIVKLLIL